MWMSRRSETRPAMGLMCVFFCMCRICEHDDDMVWILGSRNACSFSFRFKDTCKALSIRGGDDESYFVNTCHNRREHPDLGCLLAPVIVHPTRNSSDKSSGPEEHHLE
ncbi:hypothetical protein Tco_0300735 [Tanacetum coccineum]